MAWDWPNSPAVNEVFVPIPNKSYIWDGLAWNRKRPPGASASNYGDIKASAMVSDHDGWILLNGRAVTLLTLTQQAEAAKFGWIANLPDAEDAVMMQSVNASRAIGDVQGTMSRNIEPANLPAITLNTGNSAVLTTSGHDAGAVTTSNAGAHTHNITFDRSNGANTANAPGRATDITSDQLWTGPAAQSAGAHTHTVDMPNHTHTVPAHNHSIQLNAAGRTAFDITPKHMLVNHFVFLGA